MLKLTSTALRLTDAAFQFYRHTQLTPTAPREMGHQLNLGGCLLLLFFGPVCWRFMVTYTTTETLPHNEGAPSGGTMVPQWPAALGTFSVITSTCAGQTHKRQRALSELRHTAALYMQLLTTSAAIRLLGKRALNMWGTPCLVVPVSTIQRQSSALRLQGDKHTHTRTQSDTIIFIFECQAVGVFFFNRTNSLWTCEAT